MDKDFLKLTTPLFRGNLVVSDTPAPDEQVSIPDLELVDRRDFPEIPDDMELRLYRGDAPEHANACLVLIHPETSLHLPLPLDDVEALGPHIAKLRAAVIAFGMGVVPPSG